MNPLLLLFLVFSFFTPVCHAEGGRTVAEEIQGYEVKISTMPSGIKIRITKAKDGGQSLYFGEEELSVYKEAFEKFLNWTVTAKKEKVVSYEKQITTPEVLPSIKSLVERDSTAAFPVISMMIDHDGGVFLKTGSKETWSEAEVRELLAIFEKFPDLKRKLAWDDLFK